MVFVPVAIGRAGEQDQGEPRRRLNVAITAGLTAALVVVAGSLFLRDESWFEDYWPREPVEAIRAELRPEDRVFAPDRFSDWLLWGIPELRGRVSYDVRFELYAGSSSIELQEYAGESTEDWKNFADGYRIVIVDETRKLAHHDFLAEPGARAVYRGDEITVIVRPARSTPGTAEDETPPPRTPPPAPDHPRCRSPSASTPRIAREDRKSRRASHGSSGRARSTPRRRRREDVEYRRPARCGTDRFEALSAAPSGIIATARSSAFTRSA